MSSRTSEETASPTVVRELFLPKEMQTRWEVIIRVGGVSRKVIRNSHGNKILIAEIKISHGNESFDKIQMRWKI